MKHITNISGDNAPPSIEILRNRSSGKVGILPNTKATLFVKKYGPGNNRGKGRVEVFLNLHPLKLRAVIIGGSRGRIILMAGSSFWRIAPLSIREGLILKGYVIRLKGKMQGDIHTSTTRVSVRRASMQARLKFGMGGRGKVRREDNLKGNGIIRRGGKGGKRRKRGRSPRDAKTLSHASILPNANSMASKTIHGGLVDPGMND